MRESACTPEYKLNFLFLGCKCMGIVFNKEVFLDLEETYRLTQSEDRKEATRALLKYVLDLINLLIIEKEEEV